ncbi:hypothetical protein BS78_01G287800 [Paspalum vaginatum]|nr:hypothetical protein BS78_01G287800 [Paspalum vaginatum]
MLKNFLSQSWRRGAHVLLAENPTLPLYTSLSRFHSGQEKRSKNPHKHISFKQCTIAHVEPFTLDVFISKRFVSVSLMHQLTCRQVAVAGTNSKDIKAVLRSRSDMPDYLAVGRFLAERAKEANVYTCTYTLRERDRFEGKIRAVVQSLFDNGINVKLYLD